MKKVMTVLGALMFTLVIFTSCGSSSIQSDAMKVAELQCKVQTLALKATGGDMSVVTESSKLAAEALKIEEKYSSDADKAKFAEALVKAMADFKCPSTTEETTIAETPEETTSTDVKSEGAIDCDKFIKDYEVFVDSYIKILKKYKNNPTDASVMTEYTDIIQKATAMQTNAATCTDAKYTTKLMELATKMSKAATELQ